MKSNGLMPVIEKKDKAVSPIIATILLVAITVILASTLYLALGGFFSPKSVAPTASVSGTDTSTGSTPSYTVTVGSLSSTTISLTNIEILVVYQGGSESFTSTATTGWTETAQGTDFSVTGPASGTTLANGASFDITLPTATPTPVVWATSVEVIDTGSNGGVLGTWTVP